MRKAITNQHERATRDVDLRDPGENSTSLLLSEHANLPFPPQTSRLYPKMRALTADTNALG